MECGARFGPSASASPSSVPVAPLYQGPQGGFKPAAISENDGATQGRWPFLLAMDGLFFLLTLVPWLKEWNQGRNAYHSLWGMIADTSNAGFAWGLLLGASGLIASVIYTAVMRGHVRFAHVAYFSAVQFFGFGVLIVGAIESPYLKDLTLPAFGAMLLAAYKPAVVITRS